MLYYKHFTSVIVLISSFSEAFVAHFFFFFFFSVYLATEKTVKTAPFYLIEGIKSFMLYYTISFTIRFVTKEQIRHHTSMYAATMLSILISIVKRLLMKLVCRRHV